MSKNKKILVAIFVVLLLVVGLVSYKYVDLDSRNKNIKNAGQEEIGIKVDTENDGIYYNYEYGFKFNYPEDIFISYSSIKPYDNAYKARFSDAEGGTKDVSMVVFANSSDSDPIFEKYRDLPIGVPEFSKEYLSTIKEEEWPFNNAVKTKNVIIDSSNGYVLYGEYIGYKRETEPTHTNSLVVYHKDDLIMITLLSYAGENYSDDQKEKREEILDSIIDSFEFFTPQN